MIPFAANPAGPREVVHEESFIGAAGNDACRALGLRASSRVAKVAKVLYGRSLLSTWRAGACELSAHVDLNVANAEDHTVPETGIAPQGQPIRTLRLCRH